MKKWKAAGLITVAGACVIAIVWGLHGRTKNNAKLLQLDEQVSDDSVIYVALGDSITYGYSLEHAENERFSARIAAYMKQQGMQVVECNQGVNGQLSGDMWQNIKKGKVDLLDHADYVTFALVRMMHFFRLNSLLCSMKIIFMDIPVQEMILRFGEKLIKRHLSGTLRRQTGLRKII